MLMWIYVCFIVEKVWKIFLTIIVIIYLKINDNACFWWINIEVTKFYWKFLLSFHQNIFTTQRAKTFNPAFPKKYQFVYLLSLNEVGGI